MNRLLFICFLFVFINFKAQDTLFFTNSEKLTVKLLEINPGSIIYKPYQSQSATTFTVQKSELFRVVYANGIAEVFNNKAPAEKNIEKKDSLANARPKEVNPSTDTIVFNGGGKVSVKVTAINGDEIKYKMSANPDGPNYSVSKTEIKKIIFSTGLVQNFGFSGDYDVANAGRKPGQNLFEKGKSDAILYYKHKGAAIGVGCVAIGCTPVLGLIPAVSASSSDPKRKNL